MAINASTAPMGGGTPQPLLEVGNYPARVVQVIDLGLQPQSYQGQAKDPKREINVTYELSYEFMADDDGNPQHDKPRWIGEYFTLNNLKSDKAKSTKRLMGIDPNLTSKGDFSRLLGMPCTLTIVHNQGKNGNTYANVGNVTPPMRGMNIPELVNESRFFDLEDPDMETFERLPQWIQDKIMTNLEYNGSILQSKIEGTVNTGGSFPSEAGGMDDLPF